MASRRGDEAPVSERLRVEVRREDLADRVPDSLWRTRPAHHVLDEESNFRRPPDLLELRHVPSNPCAAAFARRPCPGTPHGETPALFASDLPWLAVPNG